MNFRPQILPAATLNQRAAFISYIAILASEIRQECFWELFQGDAGAVMAEYVDGNREAVSEEKAAEQSIPALIQYVEGIQYQYRNEMACQNMVVYLQSLRAGLLKRDMFAVVIAALDKKIDEYQKQEAACRIGVSTAVLGNEKDTRVSHFFTVAEIMRGRYDYRFSAYLYKQAIALALEGKDQPDEKFQIEFANLCISSVTDAHWNVVILGEWSLYSELIVSLQADPRLASVAARVNERLVFLASIKDHALPLPSEKMRHIMKGMGSIPDEKLRESFNLEKGLKSLKQVENARLHQLVKPLKVNTPSQIGQLLFSLETFETVRQYYAIPTCKVGSYLDVYELLVLYREERPLDLTAQPHRAEESKDQKIQSFVRVLTYEMLSEKLAKIAMLYYIAKTHEWFGISLDELDQFQARIISKVTADINQRHYLEMGLYVELMCAKIHINDALVSTANDLTMLLRGLEKGALIPSDRWVTEKINTARFLTAAVAIQQGAWLIAIEAARHIDGPIEYDDNLEEIYDHYDEYLCSIDLTKVPLSTLLLMKAYFAGIHSMHDTLVHENATETIQDFEKNLYDALQKYPARAKKSWECIFKLLTMDQKECPLLTAERQQRVLARVCFDHYQGLLGDYTDIMRQSLFTLPEKIISHVCLSLVHAKQAVMALANAKADGESLRQRLMKVYHMMHDLDVLFANFEGKITFSSSEKKSDLDKVMKMVVKRKLYHQLNLEEKGQILQQQNERLTINIIALQSNLALGGFNHMMATLVDMSGECLDVPKELLDKFKEDFKKFLTCFAVDRLNPLYYGGARQFLAYAQRLCDEIEGMRDLSEAISAANQAMLPIITINTQHEMKSSNESDASTLLHIQCDEASILFKTGSFARALAYYQKIFGAVIAEPHYLQEDFMKRMLLNLRYPNEAESLSIRFNTEELLNFYESLMCFCFDHPVLDSVSRDLFEAASWCHRYVKSSQRIPKMISDEGITLNHIEGLLKCAAKTINQQLVQYYGRIYLELLYSSRLNNIFSRALNATELYGSLYKILGYSVNEAIVEARFLFKLVPMGYQPALRFAANYFNSYIKDGGVATIFIVADKIVDAIRPSQFPYPVYYQHTALHLISDYFDRLSPSSRSAALSPEIIKVIMQLFDDFYPCIDAENDSMVVLYDRLLTHLIELQDWSKMKAALKNAVRVVDPLVFTWSVFDKLLHTMTGVRWKSLAPESRESYSECLDEFAAILEQGSTLDLRSLQKIRRELKKDIDRRRNLVVTTPPVLTAPDNTKQAWQSLLDTLKKSLLDRQLAKDDIDSILEKYHVLRTPERKAQLDKITGLKTKLANLQKPIENEIHSTQAAVEGEAKFSYEEASQHSHDLMESLRAIQKNITDHETSLKKAVSREEKEGRESPTKVKEPGQKTPNRNPAPVNKSPRLFTPKSTPKKPPASQKLAHSVVRLPTARVYQAHPARAYIHGAYQALINMQLLISSDLALNPHVQHYALIYNIFRCTHGLRTYIESGGHLRATQGLDVKQLSVFRNMLRHEGAPLLSQKEVLETAKKFCRDLPKSIGDMRRPHEMTNALGLAELRQLDDCFNTEEDEKSSFRIEDLSATQTMLAYHEEKKSNYRSQEEVSMYLEDLYLPAIYQILSDLPPVAKIDQHHFNDKYLYHMHAIRMLLSMCAELRQHNYEPDFRSFLNYAQNISWRVGHRFPEDYRSEELYRGVKRALNTIPGGRRDEAKKELSGCCAKKNAGC